jgi:integrase
MVPTQAGLGLRIGELLGLRASDVDILRRSMRIECQIPPGARERTEPKTPRSRRSIPLPTSLAEELAQHMADFPPAPDGSLFSTRFGGCYLHAYYGTTIFQAARRRAGLPEGTTTHDLRHHYASVLLAAGESVVAVAERLGHENAQARPVDLRPPHARQRGPDPAGARRGVVSYPVGAPTGRGGAVTCANGLLLDVEAERFRRCADLQRRPPHNH